MAGDADNLTATLNGQLFFLMLRGLFTVCLELILVVLCLFGPAPLTVPGGAACGLCVFTLMIKLIKVLLHVILCVSSLKPCLFPPYICIVLCISYIQGLSLHWETFLVNFLLGTHCRLYLVKGKLPFVSLCVNITFDF